MTHFFELDSEEKEAVWKETQLALMVLWNQFVPVGTPIITQTKRQGHTSSEAFIDGYGQALIKIATFDAMDEVTTWLERLRLDKEAGFDEHRPTDINVSGGLKKTPKEKAIIDNADSMYETLKSIVKTNNNPDKTEALKICVSLAMIEITRINLILEGRIIQPKPEHNGLAELVEFL